jgi:hypothetical protein
MSDNSIFDPGSGGDTYRSKDRAGVKTEIVGIDLGIGTGSESLMSGSMPINDNSGSITVDNGGTFAVQASLTSTTNAGATAKTSDYDTGAGTDTVTQFGIALPASGGAVQGGTATNPIRTDPTGTTTQPVSGTVTANAGTGTFTVAGSGVFHVDDNSSSLTVDNGGTFAVQDSQVLTDNAGFTDGTSKLFPGGYILDETAGTALTENDVAAARVDSKRAQVLVIEDATTRGQRASVSAGGAVKVDASGAAVPITDNSGSLTVDAPVGTPVFVTPTPSTTGGWSPYSFGGLSTTVQTVKSGAGTLGGYYFYNPNPSVAYVQIFDINSAPTLGSTAPTISIGVPATSGANLEVGLGVNMASGIRIAATTTRAGSSAPVSGLDVNLFYK